MIGVWDEEKDKPEEGEWYICNNSSHGYIYWPSEAPINWVKDEHRTT
jgi:hypothetical protein